MSLLNHSMRIAPLVVFALSVLLTTALSNQRPVTSAQKQSVSVTSDGFTVISRLAGPVVEAEHESYYDELIGQQALSAKSARRAWDMSISAADYLESSARQRFAETVSGLKGDYADNKRILEAQALAESMANRSPSAVFVVSQFTDEPDYNLFDGIYAPPTYRSAVMNANLTSAVDEITFAIGAIELGMGAVATQPVIVDGTLSGGGKVQVQGSLNSQGGMWFSGGGHTIKNIRFTSFQFGSMLALLANGGVPSTVQGCEFFNSANTALSFNTSSNNIIGGMGPGQANIFYGLTGSPAAAIQMILTSNNNTIIGNLIGTPNGTTPGGSTQAGILDEGHHNYIAYNVISGNFNGGILRSDDVVGTNPDSTHGEVVEYNKIGVSSNGLVLMGNGSNQNGNGYQSIGWVSRDTIRHNIISGSGRNGIECQSANSLIEYNICGLDINMSQDFGNTYAGINANKAMRIENNWCSGNSSGIALFGPATVRGNIVGKDQAARISVGNEFSGIQVGGDGAIIGGPTIFDRNIISGNGTDGIFVTGAVTKKNFIENNYIGTDETGIVAIPNGGCGVNIANAADSTRVFNNVIAANAKHGIQVSGLQIGINTYWAEGNLIYANKIGLGANGTTKMGNGGHGIHAFTSRLNQYGKADSGNVIVDNDSSGVVLRSSRQNFIFSNYIGTLPTSVVGYQNAGHGILFIDGDQNDIGGVSTLRNIIADNDSCGIAMYSSNQNILIENYIGLNAQGQTRANALHGILMVNSDSNTVGGATGFDGNYIAGHDSAGIAIYGASRENSVMANFIGVQFDTLQPPIGNRIGVRIQGGKRNHIGSKVAEVQNSILGNKEAGVLINGDSNFVQANLIKSSLNDPNDTTGAGDGVIVNGLGNRIGGSYNSETNSIFDNDGAGVLVKGGERNTIRGNLIYDNGRLGIDLLPVPDVTENDSLDGDTGANSLLNFPVIDSGFVANGSTKIYGRFNSTLDTTFQTAIIEFFLNSECDTLHHGEGKRFKDSLAIPMNFGETPFQCTINEKVDSNNVLTLTLTDDRGNTSEFSACWPFKVLKLVDVDSAAIKNMEFKIKRVENDIPNLTETEIGTFRTDSLGLIRLAREQVREGDSIKAERKMWEEPTPKRPTILPIAYRVFLDNGRFDLTDYSLNYKDIDTAFTQKLVLDHTTVSYNLYVSIEFDASPLYISSLTDALQQLNNYLYDVYDGQLRIDSVIVTDDYLGWSASDIRIRANNYLTPNSTGARLMKTGDGLKLPRRWFGRLESGRLLSETENPLNLGDPEHFRTIGHELGHYLLAFKDEYKYSFGSRCLPMSATKYGYMDSQYPSSEPAGSELSWSKQYTPGACKNTLQWVMNGGSCWQWFEEQQEQMYDGVLSAIIRPEERNLVALDDYFYGPNETGHALNYDVGTLLTVIDNTGAYTTSDKLVTARDIISNAPIPKAIVFHLRKQFSRVIQQGLTSDSGRIVVLGASANDDLFGAGAYNVAKSASFAALRDGNEGWRSGQLTVGAASQATLQLHSIAGSFPIIVSGTPNASGFQLRLDYGTPFAALPSVTQQPDGAAEAQYPFSLTGGDYVAAVLAPATQSGNLKINAADNAAVPFFFTGSYAYEKFVGGTNSLDLASPSGDAEFEADSLALSVNSALLVSTNYIVRREGIAADALQAGLAHSISTSPISSLPNGSVLSIRYDRSDLGNPSQALALEQSLRMHRWNEAASTWQMVGGVVDTLQRLVTSPVDQLGTFALFTTDVPSGPPCGDVDASGRIDIGDAVYMINYMFAGGPAPQDVAGGDFDCSNRTDITDVVYMINYMFAGGLAPCAACQ